MKGKTKKEVRQAVRADVRNDRKGVLNREASERVNAAFKGRNLPATKIMRDFDKSARKIAKDFSANIKEHIKVQNSLSPQANQFLALADDPFNVQWANAKMPYYSGGQPLKSTVVRAYGSASFTVNAGATGTVTQIYWQPNPAIVEGEYDVVDKAHRVLIQRSQLQQKGLAGCPPCAAPNATPVVGSHSGPHCGFIRTGVTVASGLQYVFDPIPQDNDDLLCWNTPSELGSDDLDKPGSFAYRLVAAGLRLVCTSKEVDLGGLVSSARIAEENNIGVTGTTIMNANSSAHYERGGGVYEWHYARSEADTEWYFPSASQVGAASTNISTARNFITISTPDTSTSLSYTYVCIAFYEVKGIAAKEVGTPSYQQPKEAGKIQTAMSHLAQLPTGHSKGSSKREFRDTVELVNAKESPALGGMAAEAKVLKGKDGEKGFLDKVEDFAKDVIPVAKTVAEVGMGLMAAL